MSSSLTTEEMPDFKPNGLYSVGVLTGQRSAHIYCGSDVQSLCGSSRRKAGAYWFRFIYGYIAGSQTCQKCLNKYRRLVARSTQEISPKTPDHGA